MRNRNEGSDAMRMWGSILKCFRIAAGLSHEDLARYVGYSASLVISIERGIRMPSETFVEKAEEICKSSGVLLKAAEHLSRERLSQGCDTYEEEEARTRVLWAYDVHVLHPLLRTQAYARAVWWAHRPVLSEPQIEERVKREVERQARLAAEAGCSFSFIVEENVLRRRTGGPGVMRELLEHLTVLGGYRNVTLQVMPASREAHAGLSGSMTLLQGPDYQWQAHVELHGLHHPNHQPSRVAEFQERHVHLRSLALTPHESAQFITRLAAETQ